MRLDLYLLQIGVKSRSEAKRLIENGDIEVAGKTPKPSLEITDTDEVRILRRSRYVSRGGLKLEAALNTGIDVTGLCCLDIGASTGGFTDCLLQHGAAYVYALDVGHSQLAPSLRSDERVCTIEGVNIRSVTSADFDRKIDFICCDVSFISLRQVLPVIYEILQGEYAAVLIKPQFECGREHIGKGGIVRSDKVRRAVIDDISAFAKNLGFAIADILPSPIEGGDGNKEFLMILNKSQNLRPGIDK